ncbi:MAG: SUMF1/EgtB/PvdO family nonheme iron enzyme, partial [Candidatus Brocadiae bacterium]|nr:SUMF1/EgtB/PvdO family nonheme iron enzyme [Candidatus Brocadiia bacterium]
RRQAAALTSEGAEAAEQARVLEEQIARLRSERERLMQEPARRAELWRTEASLATLEHDLSEQYTRALALHAMAVEIDTTFAEPRRFLSAHYWKRFLEAEWEGDSLRMAEARAHLRLHDPAQARACDDARGSIVVTSVPPGAAVELFRYEDGEDRRLTPRPVTERAENLPAGSYLAVLTLEGRRAARLPFAITRRFPHVTAVVHLLTEQDIGPDFIHVPAGRYVLDADSDRKVIELPDLIVGRHEVTQGEYQEWLSWLAEAEGEKKMKERLPKGWEILDGRAQPRDEKDTDPRLPIVGIAWKQARDYCRWRAQRDGLDWRLPSVLEREAFVSAADARPFPWGRTFDWMWTNGGHSLETQKALPVGSVAADESPFGIRDLAGNVKEWCADWQEKKTTKHRAIRGGAYGDMDWTEFRASSEDGDPPDEEDEEIGFRIVRTLEPGR